MTTTEPSPPEPHPGTSRSAARDGARTDWFSAIPFLAVHAAPLAALFVTVSLGDWILCGALYAVRMFFITAGYHRYFSHRSYRMSRPVQFLMALGGTTAAQKGPLWWAGHHRLHHRFSDTDRDVHSPRDGFWWSHVGWILSTRYKRTEPELVRDFASYPELRILDRFAWVTPWLVGIACVAVGGWGALLVGFLLSTVLLWHATFMVNSLAHVFGRRRFATTDTSRNSLLIALLTHGEGWHNNHHHLPASARQGFAWWEIDLSWYTLRLLAALHVVRDLKRPPARLLQHARVRDGAFDIGMFRAHWERAASVATRAGGRIGAVRALAATAGEPVDADGSGEVPTALPDATDPGRTLAGLITRALESADELATATRRLRSEGMGLPGT
ncbi:MAG: acyl-CoA desaturase [Actinomycetota bacterium]|jgi:stearoyl-CoA desaturase (delta-9 desaturase)|nr:acyl-CoA desaturase [Actinomycetota bacterium]